MAARGRAHPGGHRRPGALAARRLAHRHRRSARPGARPATGTAPPGSPGCGWSRTGWSGTPACSSASGAATGEADERAHRALARVQGMLGPDRVFTAVLGGGRGPGRPGAPGAVGRRADPGPAGRPAVAGPAAGARPGHGAADPLPAEVHDADGAPVGVTGRFAVTAAPARLAVPGRAPAEVVGWAGPWPVDERWWAPADASRRARFQVVAADGRACWSPSTAAAGGSRPATTDRRAARPLRHSRRSPCCVRDDRGLTLRTCVRVAWPPVVEWGESWAGTTRRPVGGAGAQALRAGRPDSTRPPATAGDTPAWTRRRGGYDAARAVPARPDTVPYAELHCHTNFSFLDGASHPEELAEEAARLGPDRARHHRPRRLLRGGALLRGGPGAGAAHHLRRRAVARACPARRTASPTRPGRTCWCWPAARRGTPGCAGDHRRGPAGRRGEGPPGLRPGASSPRELRGHVLVLTGCRKGHGPGGAAHRRAVDAARRGSWTG